MSGNKEGRQRRQTKKLGIAYFWTGRHRLPTVHWTSKLAFTPYIYFDGRCPRSGIHYISYKKFTHYLAIIFTSAGLFGIGIGELAAEILKR